ncbi:MAG TPA: type VI secretion system tip protein TssI/VgrG [Pyrinomonadaceae bacterium]|nr:type VI secretion system tip protein TssI/VgrG [Pyrinomonadaceae bacterium]
MPTYTQQNRPISVKTPLGEDVLLLIGFEGHESISRLFNFRLDLLAEDADKIEFDKLLGQKITITLVLPDDRERYFSGICNRISQGARTEGDIFTSYGMEVVPTFWLLSKRVQSRIFQHITVPDILKKVLAGVDANFQIQGTFYPRDFCVQYRESDFDFASRLMEEEGIFYFFKHSADGHQMIVANTPQSHPEFETDSEKKVIYEALTGGRRDETRVTAWEKTQELRSGKYTLWDHSFELPHKHLEAEVAIVDSVQAGEVTHKLKVGDNSKLELYDFPGAYAQRFDGVNKGGGEQAGDLTHIFEDNKRTTKIRMQAETVPGLVIKGNSNCRHFTSGYRFDLEQHFNADGSYILTELAQEARITAADYRSAGDGEFTYENRFACIPDAVPYRPERLTQKPTVKGTQTAVAVGPAGEEIFTDKYGRVKVQFHWDREGKNDADSSCWVRVAQQWAGKRWGSSFWPRIGQEVVVDFLEGDPDQPIIVGSVYNADQMPPYLGQGPDSKHKNDNKLTGIKSNTTKGGVGFNEWRFDDTKGKEQIFIHGERNMDVRVKNDSMERVGANRHLIVGYEKDGKKGGDQKEKVFRHKHLHVLGNQEEKIDGNVTLTIGHGEADDGGNQNIVIEKDKSELIGGEHHHHVKGAQFGVIDFDRQWTVSRNSADTIENFSHVHIKKDRNEKVDLNQSLTVGLNQAEKVGVNHALEAGMQIHLKAGMSVIIEAGLQLTLKVGGNFIDISPAGVCIQGTFVMINSGGAPGTGQGANPTAPKDANKPDDAKEANPEDPDIADDSVTGQKSAPD